MQAKKAAITRHNKSVMNNEQVLDAHPFDGNTDIKFVSYKKIIAKLNLSSIYRLTSTDADKNLNTYAGLKGYSTKKRDDGHTYSFRHLPAFQPICGMFRRRTSTFMWDLVDRIGIEAEY